MAKQFISVDLKWLFVCWQIASLQPDLWHKVCFHLFVLPPSVISRVLWFSTTACCICVCAPKLDCFLLMMIFLSLADNELLRKSWKEWRYPLFGGPALRWELFKELVFIWTSREKRAAPPPPSFIHYVTVTTLSWCFQDRKSLMCNLVVWPNRPDVELRRSWHLAFGHIFVSEIFKYILQVLHKWKCNKMKNPLWHFSCCTGL